MANVTALKTDDIAGAMRRIEDELTEGHEVLIREPAPVLIGSGWLRRGNVA